jgi:ABC-2 type transport system ATP-binding protein
MQQHDTPPVQARTADQPTATYDAANGQLPQPVNPTPAGQPPAAVPPPMPYAPAGQPMYGNMPPPFVAPPDAAVVMQNLTRVFGAQVAVNNLTLAVRRGEFFGFLGPNGAGKSTTIKMLIGQLRPSQGTAWVSGCDVQREPLRARALMGVLPEQMNLYERLSGREFLTLAGNLYQVPRGEIKGRTNALLGVLALSGDADKLIVDYSVGMRKKIALAAALIHRPQVLFLDEPFEGVDPVSSRVIRNILNDLTKSGTTIFFSSHLLELVERLCTRVGIINHGVLVAEGTLDELRQRAQAEGDHTAATLEDVFLQVVGAETERGGLAWLE